MKNHLKATLTVAAIMSLGLGTLVLDSVTCNVHAEETEVNVNVPVTLAITSHTPTVNIDASNPNQFYTGTASIVSTTNNPTGYTLTMADKDTNTDLVNPDYDSSTTPASFAGTIGSIASPITVDGTGSNFTVNKWGYAKESATTTFLPIPASTAAEEVKKTDAPAETSTATVTFGTKINKDLVSGAYSDTVVFSLTANAVVRDITKLTSMQDLANHPEYCTNTEVGVSTTIPDERDPSGKQYKIKKLADGNCWMVDNMKLASITIEPTLSNVPTGTSFNLPAAVAVSTSSGGPTWANQAEEAHVLDGTSAVDSGGYLYNWYAATAGAKDASGNSLMTAASGEAAGDICPRGWKLPDNEGTKSFYNLYNAEYPTGTKVYNSSDNMRNADGIYPGFVYTGGYYYSSGAVTNTGAGLYWSRAVYSATGARVLYFYSSGVVSQDSDNKGYGFTVRCVSAY